MSLSTPSHPHPHPPTPSRPHILTPSHPHPHTLIYSLDKEKFERPRVINNLILYLFIYLCTSVFFLLLLPHIINFCYTSSFSSFLLIIKLQKLKKKNITLFTQQFIIVYPVYSSKLNYSC